MERLGSHPYLNREATSAVTQVDEILGFPLLIAEYRGREKIFLPYVGCKVSYSANWTRMQWFFSFTPAQHDNVHLTYVRMSDAFRFVFIASQNL